MRVLRLHRRYQGKIFYMELEGKGKMPVMHFGMTGMLQVGHILLHPGNDRRFPPD